MATVTVSITNYETYKGRSDVKHNSWFRCSNRLLEDHEFFDFSHEEILVWIYILSLASQKNTHKVLISEAHAHSIARLSPASVNSALRKLKKIGVIEVGTLRGRYARDTDTCATDRHTDITNKTDIQELEFVAFWNDQSWDLPKVSKITASRRQKIRKRLSEAPIEDWKLAISKIHESTFLLGKDSKSTWKASFDWLIENETNGVKVLEGKYKSSALSKSEAKDWLGTADRIWNLCQQHSYSLSPTLREQLGPDLVAVVKATGELYELRTQPKNDFTLKTFASRLKAAHEILSQQKGA